MSRRRFGSSSGAHARPSSGTYRRADPGPGWGVAIGMAALALLLGLGIGRMTGRSSPSTSSASGMSAATSAEATSVPSAATSSSARPTVRTGQVSVKARLIGRDILQVENQGTTDLTGVTLRINGQYTWTEIIAQAWDRKIPAGFKMNIKLDAFENSRGQSFGPVNIQGIDKVDVTSDQGTWSGGLSR